MESVEQLWGSFPQDILTLIFKYLPIAPDRWNCLFDCSVVPKQRNWDELGRKVIKPKKFELDSTAFLGYLKKCHREVVVELDLSFAAVESEGDYLPRKFNVSYAPEYNEDHMNTFWSLMLDFPNLRNLSLYQTFFAGGSSVSFGPPANKNLRSSVRNLNLIKQQLFYHSHDSFQTILEYCPDLEVLQANEISESDVELIKEHPKLKQLLLVYCNVSPTNIIEKCPNLEVFVNHKYDHNWGVPDEEVPKPDTKSKVLLVSGDRKPLRDLPIETITKNAKAIQNVRYATAAGVPLLTDLITGDQREHMEVCLTALKLDPNIKYRTKPDVKLDPFVLMYPYDPDSENRDWGDHGAEPSAPKLLHNGDTPLHFAIKKRHGDLAKMLLENGANPNAQNSDYQTPICFTHHPEAFDFLLENGASLHVLDKNGWNLAMNIIANKGRLYGPTEQEIEGHISFNDNSRTHDPEAPLKVLERLVELGCDINYQAPNGFNALKVALSVGDELIVDYLLKHMKAPMEEKKSPCIGLLSCVAASRSPKVEMIDRLLKLGADPTIVDEAGQTYLHVAAERGRTHLLTSVESVEDRAKLLSLTDAAGYTCLHYASLLSSTEVIWEADVQYEYLKFLEKKLTDRGVVQNDQGNAGVDLDLFFALAAEAGVVDVPATSGETALLLSCRSFTEREFVKRLLTHGANPNVVDRDGGSPLIAAAYVLDDELVELLLQHGADVAHCDSTGVNALLAAAFAVVKKFCEVRVHNYQQGLRDTQRKLVKESDKKAFGKIFELLLKNKVNVNQQEKLCGFNVLHVLANVADELVAEWLTTLVKEHGADINARCWINEAPLHCAIKQRNIVPAKTLMQLGADVNARGYGNLTPLHYILEVNHSLHSLNAYSLSDDQKICVDGYKIVANTLVRYPSWTWSSFEDHSQNPTISYYEGETEVVIPLFVELFKLADKLDFNVQTFLGNLPLHGCWFISKNMVDVSNITQGLIDPKHFILAVPQMMLKHATREQLLTKNLAEVTPFEALLNSTVTTLRPNNMAGLYPGVKEAYDMLFKRCVELIGDTIDINHVIVLATMQSEQYDAVELLVKKAKENGKFNLSDMNKSSKGSISAMMSAVLTDAKIYALMKDVVGPLWSQPIDRRELSSVKDEPALFNFISTYSSACGYEENISRPKMLNELIASGGVDWNLVSPTSGENLLQAMLGWFRNIGCEALLFNQIWLRKNVIEADKIFLDLIKVGVDPHHKNKIGQSFADLVPQYQKILDNAKRLLGEDKKAFQKENYFVDKKPSELQKFTKAITY